MGENVVSGVVSGRICTPRVQPSALATIAQRVTVYRPGVGLVDVAGDWRERMDARLAAIYAVAA